MLTRRNAVRVWVDGGRAFRRLEKLLRTAQHTIVIQMFIWKDDPTGRRIAAVLVEAADRGVYVNITKEAVGDFFEFSEAFLDTRGSSDSVWHAFWHHKNIRIRYENDRDHAKVYVIDEQILLLTGMNIADENRYDLHDYLVELRGTEYVRQFLLRENHPASQDGVTLVMNTEARKAVRTALQSLLASARRSIVVEHSYLSDPETIDALIALTHRSVRVTVIVPTTNGVHHHANMLSVGRLVREGKQSHMRTLLYDGHSHAKLILVDRRTAFLGSANLMKSSLDDMGEVNVLICGRRRALVAIRDALRHSILHSHPLKTSPSLLWFSKWLAWVGL